MILFKNFNPAYPIDRVDVKVLKSSVLVSHSNEIPLDGDATVVNLFNEHFVKKNNDK